jgi:hypothetical protein
MTANRTGSLCDSLLGPADQSAPSQLGLGRNLRTIHSEWPVPSAIHLGEGTRLNPGQACRLLVGASPRRPSTPQPFLASTARCPDPAWQAIVATA